MTDATAHEESKDKGDNVVLSSPDVDINTGKDGQEREAPGDAIDDGAFTGREELVNNESEEEQMDEGPDSECPWGGGEVGFFTGAVDGVGCSDAVDVGAEEKDIHDNVHDLEEDPVFPIVRHVY